MIGAKPQQLDAAVRLVLSGSNGSLIRDSWPDLWDSAHRLVRSADRGDLWESLCRLSGTTAVADTAESDGSEKQAGAQTASHANGGGEDGAAPDQETTASSAVQHADLSWQAPISPREVATPAATRQQIAATRPSRILLGIAYVLVAAASLLVGLGIIALIARPHATLTGIRQVLRNRSAVEVLILVALALGGWACVDWLSTWTTSTANSLRSGPVQVARRAVPFAAAFLVAAAGVLLLLRGSIDSGTGSFAALSPGQVAKFATPVSAALQLRPGGTLSSESSSGEKEWALPLAASIIIQGAGLIRPAALLPVAGTATPSPTPTPAAVASRPALPATLPAVDSLSTQALRPTAGLTTSSPSPASTPAAIPPQATPATAAAQPAVLPPAGFPPPPFALLLPGSPLTATTLNSTPAISAAVDVRSALPGAPSAFAGSPGQSPVTTADAISTVAAAGPTAPAAHVRFGPPPPSPR